MAIAYIMPMTAVPQRTAMSHACGALAAALGKTAREKLLSLNCVNYGKNRSA